MPVELISKIKPKTSGGGLGQFPVYEDVDVEGGFQVRADLTDRDSIYTLNRKEGMHVFVRSNGKIYRLDGGITNLHWVEVTIGGGTTVSMRRLNIPDSSFVYSPPISTTSVTIAPSSDPGLLELRDLWRNGVYQPTMVSGTPAADGEWRLNGSTLEIYGDVTSAGDFTVRYPT